MIVQKNDLLPSFFRLDLANLVSWKNQKDRKPLILKGARQVGKTTLLKQFGVAHFEKCHYFNFEKEEALKTIFNAALGKDLKPLRIVKELELYQNEKIHPTKDLVIFDEIQECPEALTSLKYFKEEKKELAIASAGSLLGVQLSTKSFPVGAVDFHSLYPMSFEEFLNAHGEIGNAQLSLQNQEGEVPVLQHAQLWEHFKNYCVVGGLPESVGVWIKNKDNTFSAFEQVRKTQDNLIKTYLADMAKHCGKQNSMHLVRLWNQIPAQLARSQDGSTSKFIFKGVIPGISIYQKLVGVIDWLENAGLIIKVPIVNRAEIPFSAFTKENQFKLFLFDVGLLGALSDLPAKTILNYDYGTYKGYFAENFVAQEFLFAQRKQLFGWSEKESEIEFLIEVNGQVVPVEVKSGHITKAKSLKVFKEKYSPRNSVILSAKNLVGVSAENKTSYFPIYYAGKLRQTLSMVTPEKFMKL
jgi:predicted AAA+ superfamily ATPase